MMDWMRLVELVGHLARSRPGSRGGWASPSRPALMERLVKLPIRYFSSSSGMNALFPTRPRVRGPTTALGQGRGRSRSRRGRRPAGRVLNRDGGARCARGRLPEAEWARRLRYLAGHVWGATRTRLKDFVPRRASAPL